MKQSRFLSLIVLLTVLFGSVSCVSQKKLSYLRNVTAASADSVNQNFLACQEAQIKCEDFLSITVNALDIEAVQAFNLPVANTMRLGTGTVNSSGGTLQSYQVDRNGNINFPILGLVHVEGLTISEAKSLLEEMISESVNNPIVNITFQNFHITVLGEVKNPGRYTISDQRVTILEGIGLAGDLTIYGKRNNLLICRETNGQMQFERVNLNDETLFSSPFYYLQQNDVLYVEPNTARAISSQNVSLYLSMIGTILSSTTTIIAIVNVSRTRK